MRSNYPVSSTDFNDRILLAYENMVYLLGIQSDTTNLTGLYDTVDQSGLAFMVSTSGIPHCGTYDGKYQVGLYKEVTHSYVPLLLKTNYVLSKYLGAF